MEATWHLNWQGLGRAIGVIDLARLTDLPQRSFSNDDASTTLDPSAQPTPAAAPPRTLLPCPVSSCDAPPSFSRHPHAQRRTTVAMADNVEGLIDVPREFLKDGVQFINKCQKRESARHRWS